MLSEFLAKALSFLTVIIGARILGSEVFGELTLYFILFEIIQILISNNISTVTRIDYFNEEVDIFYFGKSAHLVASFLTSIVLTVIFFLIAYNCHLKIDFLLIMVLASLLRTFSLFVLATLQCNRESHLYTKLNTVYLFTWNFCFIFLININGDISNWFYSLLIGAFLQFFFALKYKVKDLPNLTQKMLGLGLNDIFAEFKKGLAFFPQAVGFWIKFGTDRFLMNIFCSSNLLGNYMLTFQFSSMIVVFTTAINLFLTPKINSFIVADSIDNLKQIFRNYVLLIVLFSISSYYITKYIIFYFFIDEYEHSINFLVPVFVSITLYSITLIYLNLFYYVNMGNFLSIFILSISIVNFIVGFISIKYLEINGLLYANIFINGLAFIYIYWKVDYKFFQRKY